MLFVCSKNTQDQVEPVALCSLAWGQGQDSGPDWICLGLACPGREGAGDGLPRPGPNKLGGRRRLACPLLSLILCPPLGSQEPALNQIVALLSISVSLSDNTGQPPRRRKMSF